MLRLLQVWSFAIFFWLWGRERERAPYLSLVTASSTFSRRDSTRKYSTNCVMSCWLNPREKLNTNSSMRNFGYCIFLYSWKAAALYQASFSDTVGIYYVSIIAANNHSWFHTLSILFHESAPTTVLIRFSRLSVICRQDYGNYLLPRTWHRLDLLSNLREKSVSIPCMHLCWVMGPWGEERTESHQ